MKPQANYPERTSGFAETRLAWLIALVASGLVLVAGALALDLHNQKRRLESMGAQLKQAQAVREAEAKYLEARSKLSQSALNRLNEVQAEGESDLKKLGDAYTQREPVVKQSTELQNKIQALVNDLMILAKSDEDAKAIIRKYNIQQQGPPPSGAPTAKP